MKSVLSSAALPWLIVVAFMLVAAGDSRRPVAPDGKPSLAERFMMYKLSLELSEHTKKLYEKAFNKLDEAEKTATEDVARQLKYFVVRDGRVTDEPDVEKAKKQIDAATGAAHSAYIRLMNSEENRSIKNNYREKSDMMSYFVNTELRSLEFFLRETSRDEMEEYLKR